MNLKKLPVNFILMLGTIFLFFLVGELLFPYVLQKIPIKLQGNVDRELLTLVQSSKKSIVPNNYIAIVGDSYAAGIGEWLYHERKQTLTLILILLQAIFCIKNWGKTL